MTLTLENKNITIDPLDKSSEQHLSVKQNVTLMITSPADCKHLSKLSLSYQLDLKEHEWYNFVIGGVGNQMIGHIVKQNITPAPPHGRAKLCTLLFSLPPDDNSFDILLDKHRVQENVLVLGKAVCIVLSADHYKMTVVGRKSSKVYASSEVLLKNGGIYTAVVQENKKGYANPAEVLLFKDLDARNVSMLYQIPQYFVMTSGEILFSITGEHHQFIYDLVTFRFCMVKNVVIVSLKSIKGMVVHKMHHWLPLSVRFCFSFTQSAYSMISQKNTCDCKNRSYIVV